MDNFDVLKEGQWVKVKGMAENGAFQAHEVKIRPAGDQSVMEGKIQSVDPEKRTISLMHVTVPLSADVVVKNAARQDIQLSTLKNGEIVKLKGEYQPGSGFKPAKVKLQEPKGVDYSELQGYINRLDRESRTIDVLGISVAVGNNTEIEGF